MNKALIYFFLLFGSTLTAQIRSADNGDGTYQNPILHADFSDPDVVRVGDDFWMTTSSFNCIPGLPILHSKDLVNWQIVNYALKKQPPFDVFDKPQHGGGVWAPAIRYHNGEFFIIYPDPDFGIYMIKTRDPRGDWSEPVLMKAGKGLIDPCPFWDEDGKAYLAHAFAGSRAGIKSIIVICRMSIDATKILDDGVLVFDGHDAHPTIEGPKVYKRNGFYYLSAPAGGVSTGWQLILRSKNIYGPYEEKIVLAQGKTTINGPHQGGWVDVPSPKKGGESEWWFLHFQDKDAYGRVVHLQPMVWKNDWPVIGVDADGDGKGEPVLRYKKPNIGKIYPTIPPSVSDDFKGNILGHQWQWHANSKPYWAFPSSGKGNLRLFSYQLPENFKNYWDVSNLLLQKFPAEEFVTTTKLSFNPRLDGEKFGFTVFGLDYAYLSLTKKGNATELAFSTCKDADKGTSEKETVVSKLTEKTTIFMRVSVKKGGVCQFSYSSDGMNFTDVGEPFTARVGKWIGAKMGFFCTRTVKTNDSGFADIDYFEVK